MSWHYSQALVEAFLEENSLDGELFAPLKSSDMPETYCWRDRMTESLNLFQFGMMCEPSMGNLGADLLTWFREVSLAKIFRSPVRCGGEMGWTGTGPVYGDRCCELLTRFARPMYSVKTHQLSEGAEWLKSSESLPPSGMIADGSLWELSLSDSITNAYEYGSTLPTPTARDWKDTPGMAPERRDGKTRLDRLPMLLFAVVRGAGISSTMIAENMDAQTVTLKDLVRIEIKGQEYSPELPEWTMGWPIGWTDLKPLEMGRFQVWLRLHGQF